MRTVSIGDTHGAAVADVVSGIIDDHDKFIFIGDYVDSLDSDTAIKKNLLDIIGLKKSYPEKIVLLWGNHDIHYLLGEKYYCSGYNPNLKNDLHGIFKTNAELFQLAFQEGNYLWTHAGVSTWWYENRLFPFAEKQKGLSISELLNMAFDKRFRAIFDVGYSRGGNFETGGPLWCDISELKSRPLKGVNQIVGHNRVDHIHKINPSGNEIIFIDNLHNAEEVNPSYFLFKEL